MISDDGMDGDQGVSFFDEVHDQFVSSSRTPICIYMMPFLNSTALSLIPKHTDYTIQPQGLSMLSPRPSSLRFNVPFKDDNAPISLNQGPRFTLVRCRCLARGYGWRRSKLKGR